ncbi:putative reverse transcriptase domain-containing protein [Tanacetum coccineum]
MDKLTQKKVKFEWGDKQEAAFQLLKQKLCSAPILALPEGSEDFIAYCDASKKGLGAVLMQREKVISYASRQLKIHEKKLIQNLIWKLGAVCVRSQDGDIISMELSVGVPDAQSFATHFRSKRVEHEATSMILNAQTEARKPENIKSEDVGGMLIENAKFPEAIRDTSLGQCADGTCASMARSGYLVMEIYDLSRTIHNRRAKREDIQNLSEDIAALLVQIDFGKGWVRPFAIGRVLLI